MINPGWHRLCSPSQVLVGFAVPVVVALWVMMVMGLHPPDAEPTGAGWECPPSSIQFIAAGPEVEMCVDSCSEPPLPSP